MHIYILVEKEVLEYASRGPRSYYILYISAYVISINVEELARDFYKKVF